MPRNERPGGNARGLQRALASGRGFAACVLLVLLVGGCVTATTETIVMLDTDIPRNRAMTVSISVIHASGAASDGSFDPSGAHGHVWVRAIGAATPTDAGPTRDAIAIDGTIDAGGYDASRVDAQVRDAIDNGGRDTITLPASLVAIAATTAVAATAETARPRACAAAERAPVRAA